MNIAPLSTGIGYGQSSGSPLKIPDIKADITAAKNKLEKLDREGRENSAEASKLNMQIERYEKRLSELKDKKNESEISKSEQKRRFDSFECQTCKNRRYQDDSDDSGVSFQSSTKIAPHAADAAVRSHENEHVARNKLKAEQNGMKIVYQSVTIHKAICPECGKIYTAGGVTRTRMKTDTSQFDVGMFDAQNTHGKALDTVA